MQIRCLLRLIFWSVLSVLWGNKSQAAVEKMETANGLSWDFFGCFCGVSGFCCGLFCHVLGWARVFFVSSFFWLFFSPRPLLFNTHIPHSCSPIDGQANAVLVTTHSGPLTSDAQWRLFWKKPILDIKAEFMCGLPSYLLSPNAGVSFEVATFHDQCIAKSDH